MLNKPPSFTDLENFLVSRIYTLEALERSLPRNQQANANSARSSTGARAHTTTATEQKCAFCGSGHYLSACPKYLEKTPEQRRELVTAKNLCYNCLGPHQVKACRNAKRCRLCRKQHHTTLHLQSTVSDTSQISSSTSSAIAQPSTSHTTVQERNLTSLNAIQNR